MHTLTPDERRSILLIDDDELIAGSLRQILQSDGCDVDSAPDASAATVLMANRRYSVILVDHYFTGGVHRDEGDVIAVIRDLQPDASLIVLTGYPSPVAGALSDARVSACLTKPQPVTFLNQFVLAACSRGVALSQPSIKGRP